MHRACIRRGAGSTSAEAELVLKACSQDYSSSKQFISFHERLWEPSGKCSAAMPESGLSLRNHGYAEQRGRFRSPVFVGREDLYTQLPPSPRGDESCS